MDDIIVFTKTIEEHRQVTHKVLEILKKNNLYVKPEKCEFEKEEVDYLGVIVSEDKVAVDPAKAKAVSDWPRPQKLIEVQEFVGFLNFYQRFIRDFSRIARPLHDLTKKGVSFNWTDKCKGVFQMLKGAICQAPILSMAHDQWRMWIEADACQYTVGGVLLQEQDNLWKLIAFYSKSLDEVE